MDTPTTPPIDLDAIEARRNAAREWLASDHTAPHVWPEGASYEGGERCLRCGSTVPAGVCLSSRTMQFLDARRLLRDANDDLRALLTEVRRLTAALATARLDGARAMQERAAKILDECEEAQDRRDEDGIREMVGALGRDVRRLDPAAVVGSGS